MLSQTKILSRPTLTADHHGQHVARNNSPPHAPVHRPLNMLPPLPPSDILRTRNIPRRTKWIRQNRAMELRTAPSVTSNKLVEIRQDDSHPNLHEHQLFQTKSRIPRKASNNH